MDPAWYERIWKYFSSLIRINGRVGKLERMVELLEEQNINDRVEVAEKRLRELDNSKQWAPLPPCRCCNPPNLMTSKTTDILDDYVFVCPVTKIKHSIPHKDAF